VITLTFETWQFRVWDQRYYRLGREQREGINLREALTGVRPVQASAQAMCSTKLRRPGSSLQGTPRPPGNPTTALPAFETGRGTRHHLSIGELCPRLLLVKQCRPERRTVELIAGTSSET
jgi:hypothetical protein